MKVSFGIKFGALMLIAIMALVGSILVFFHQESMSNMKTDLKDRIGDVARTSAFILNEEDRILIENFRDQIYARLPADYEKTISNYERLSKSGDELQSNEEQLFSMDASSNIQNEYDFQYIVQLLRRMQAGSKVQADTLAFLEQEKLSENDSSDVAWAYLMVRLPGVEANNTLMILADSHYQGDANNDANPIGTLYASDEFFAKAFKSEIAVSEDWYEDKYGKLMSGVVPIKNDNGEVIAALGLDWLVEDFSQRINERKNFSLVIFVFAVAMALVLTFLITAWISIPLGKLKIGAEQLSKQDFEHKVSIKSKDEFGLLASTFNKVSVELGKFTRDLDGIVQAKTTQLTKAKEELLALNNMLSKENAHLGAEVSNLIALREQNLPYLNRGRQHTSFNDYDIAFHYLPSQAVCGDFWQVQNDDKQTNVTFGQMSGYGLETAMMAMQAQSLLKAYSDSREKPLTTLNQYLYEQQQSINLKLYCKVLSVQIIQDQLMVMGSGETPIKYTSKDTSFIQLANMLPLGVAANIELESVTLSLRKNEGLLLFNAGFKEALAKLHNVNADKMRPADIIEFSGVLNDNASALLEKIEQQAWFDEFNQDISFIVIRHKGSL
jgi:HAMP domain-containing protein